MRISISIPDIPDQDILTLEVGPDMTMADLKALIEGDTNVPPETQMLSLNGVLLDNQNAYNQTLAGLGIADGDMLSMTSWTSREQSRLPSNRTYASRSAEGAETLRSQALRSSPILDQIRQARPQLADAVQDPRRFRDEYTSMLRDEERREQEKQAAFARLERDPFSEEGMAAQREMEEVIQRENIELNITHALENNPEVFGRVSMLYIDVEVDGHKVKAFVDSGAQTTIMSPSCAETCGIMRLVDKRFAGMARGVGTAKILGRVHSASIKIGSSFLPCSFTVMEGKDVDLLLGLDMLKRYQASIDLRKGKLIIQDEEIPFLGEAEIPKTEETVPEPTVSGPDGTQIGGRSGTVIPPTSPGTQTTSSVPQSTARNVLAPVPLSQPVAPRAQVPPVQQQSESSPSQANVERLMQMGFSQQAAITALEMAGGDVETAAGLLFE